MNNQALRQAARAVVDRWDSPLWKDLEHTGETIARLRDALDAEPASVPSEMSLTAIRTWWASENGLEDCDMCKFDDFVTVVRAVEKKLGTRPAAEPSQSGSAGEALLATAPKFEECETPEPSLSSLIYRYYRAHFEDRAQADGYASRYIAALSRQAPAAPAEAGEALIERLKQEARIHAQEARTANATIAEIYQIVTGKTGEPGNWNGAEPVRKCIEELRSRLPKEQS